MTRRLTWLLPALVLALPGCKGDRNDPARTEKVIEEVKDDVAAAQNDIQKRQDDLVENQGQSARDRAAFIDATEKEMADLDRRIQELRAHVQSKGNDLGGEARRDLSQDVADLEATRNEARAALDRFRAQTGGQMSHIEQVTEEAMTKLRRAVKDADERLDADTDDGARDPKSPPCSPLTRTSSPGHGALKSSNATRRHLAPYSLRAASPPSPGGAARETSRRRSGDRTFRAGRLPVVIVSVRATS